MHCRQLHAGAVGILARHWAMVRRGCEHTGNTAYQDLPAPAAEEEVVVGHRPEQGLARHLVEQPWMDCAVPWWCCARWGAGGVGQSGSKVGECRHRLAVASRRSAGRAVGRKRLSCLDCDITGLEVFLAA